MELSSCRNFFFYEAGFVHRGHFSRERLDEQKRLRKSQVRLNLLWKGGVDFSTWTLAGTRIRDPPHTQSLNTGGGMDQSSRLGPPTSDRRVWLEVAGRPQLRRRRGGGGSTNLHGAGNTFRVRRVLCDWFVQKRVVTVPQQSIFTFTSRISGACSACDHLTPFQVTSISAVSHALPMRVVLFLLCFHICQPLWLLWIESQWIWGQTIHDNALERDYGILDICVFVCGSEGVLVVLCFLSDPLILLNQLC